MTSAGSVPETLRRVREGVVLAQTLSREALAHTAGLDPVVSDPLGRPVDEQDLLVFGVRAAMQVGDVARTRSLEDFLG